MDKFDCLKVFSRVAQLGSFTAAANELNYHSECGEQEDRLA